MPKNLPNHGMRPQAETLLNGSRNSITLFSFITMFDGLIVFLEYCIIKMNLRNISQSIVNPIEHCYGSELCYVIEMKQLTAQC